VAARSCGQGHNGCIAPWHLSWKTQAENTADAVEQGTIQHGERHAHAKLTEQDVAAIRSLAGKEPQAFIAQRFGVSQKAVSKIITGKTWRHVLAGMIGTQPETLTRNVGRAA
jgi:hypothetical protein